MGTALSPTRAPGYDQMIEETFRVTITSQSSFSQILNVSILAYIGYPPEEAKPCVKTNPFALYTLTEGSQGPGCETTISYRFRSREAHRYKHG